MEVGNQPLGRLRGQLEKKGRWKWKLEDWDRRGGWAKGRGRAFQEVWGSCPKAGPFGAREGDCISGSRWPGEESSLVRSSVTPGERQRVKGAKYRFALQDRTWDFS